MVASHSCAVGKWIVSPTEGNFPLSHAWYIVYSAHPNGFAAPHVEDWCRPYVTSNTLTMQHQLHYRLRFPLAEVTFIRPNSESTVLSSVEILKNSLLWYKFKPQVYLFLLQLRFVLNTSFVCWSVALVVVMVRSFIVLQFDISLCKRIFNWMDSVWIYTYMYITLTQVRCFWM